MKINILDKFRHETHNPLLMYRGCNPIPDVGIVGVKNLPIYEKFHSLYQEAIQQTQSKNLVFGLEVSYSDTDKGFGGFYNGGYVPTNLFSDLGADTVKDFNFYWPRDPFSKEGKFMRYVGSINLGIWPKVLHDALCYPSEGYRKYQKSYVLGYDQISQIKNIFPSKIWMHLFTSSQGEFDSVNSDCHVKFTSEIDYDSMSSEYREICKNVYSNKNWTTEQIRELIILWQENNTVKLKYITPPSKFFHKITPRFYFDGLKRTAKMDDLSDDEIGIFAYGRGECSVFGVPQSQQEARRFISTDSYNGIRALTPMFSFSDSEHDMTHQFYADALLIDQYHITRAMCKLDSSCT